jgi:hypothetical protein
VSIHFFFFCRWKGKGKKRYVRVWGLP